MIKINLLPYRDERKKETILLQAIFAAVPFLIVFLIFAVLWITNNAQITSAEKEIDRMNKQISECTLKMKEIDDYKSKKEVLIKKMEVINDLQKGKNGPVHLMDELATCIPGNIWLTSIKQKGMALVLEGSAIDNIAISNYMINLEKSPYINNVDLKSIIDQTGIKSSKKNALKKFVITCNLTYTPEKTG
jgi:type IV pilus assembly protein PilN